MSGSITVICGPMFSGKSAKLIYEALSWSEETQGRIQCFKPAIDKRYHDTKIVSHDGLSIDAEAVPDEWGIFTRCTGPEAIFIDEAQFFGPSLPGILLGLLRDYGCHIFLAGLDMDSSGKSFGPMNELLMIADHVIKMKADCAVCGKPASRTYRKTKEEGQVVVGGSEAFEARCFECWTEGRK